MSLLYWSYSILTEISYIMNDDDIIGLFGFSLYFTLPSRCCCGCGVCGLSVTGSDVSGFVVSGFCVSGCCGSISHIIPLNPSKQLSK